MQRLESNFFRCASAAVARASFTAIGKLIRKNEVFITPYASRIVLEGEVAFFLDGPVVLPEPGIETGEQWTPAVAGSRSDPRADRLPGLQNIASDAIV